MALGKLGREVIDLSAEEGHLGDESLVLIQQDRPDDQPSPGYLRIRLSSYSPPTSTLASPADCRHPGSADLFFLGIMTIGGPSGEFPELADEPNKGNPEVFTEIKSIVELQK